MASNSSVHKARYSVGLEEYKVSHSWTIGKFSFWMDASSNQPKRLKLTLPTFSTGVNAKNTWNVTLYLQGQDNNTDYISYSVTCQSCKKSDPTLASGEIWIRNTESSGQLKEYMKAFNLCSFTESTDIIYYSNVMQKSVIRQKSEKLLPGDKLTICLDMTVYCPTNSIMSNTPPVPSTQMISDYEELYLTGKCSDVEIVISGKLFKAHKAILAARSDVFLVMFENDTTEKSENKVEIEDVEPNVFDQLLRYIYTDQAPDSSAITIDLLVEADEYGLEILKNICETALGNSITVKNAAANLVLAERHDAKQLMKKLMRFINTNSSKVLDTEGFKELEKSYPHLLTELYRSKQ